MPWKYELWQALNETSPDCVLNGYVIATLQIMPKEILLFWNQHCIINIINNITQYINAGTKAGTVDYNAIMIVYHNAVNQKSYNMWNKQGYSAEHNKSDNTGGYNTEDKQT